MDWTARDMVSVVSPRRACGHVKFAMIIHLQPMRFLKTTKRLPKCDEPNGV